MNKLDFQETYWDSVATKKTFSHSININQFREVVLSQNKILDYGCGYGRTCAELIKNGYSDVVGIDISLEMINRGLSFHPSLKLKHVDAGRLPFKDNTFSACTLFAVLTCIPTDAGQKEVVKELYRILRPDGILYISDYPLQEDNRNNERYRQFKNEYGHWGVFRLTDGGVFRHHTMPWVYELLSQFDILREDNIEVSTMNGNKAKIFQIIANKVSNGQ